MKKLLVVLLALTLFGVFAFAQDAAPMAPKPLGTFTAWNEGIAYLYNQTGSADATANWGPNWDPTHGIDQEWSFNYDGNNYGFSGTFEFGMADFVHGTFAANNTTDVTNTLSWFNTYYKFGKMVELQIGKLLAGDYRAPGGLIEGQFVKRIASGEFGPMLQVMPIDGLSIGAFANIPVAGINVSDYGTNLNFGAAYSMPDMFKATLTYRTVDSILNGGVSVTALKPVTIVVGFQNNPDMFVYASAGGKFIENLTTNVDVKYVAKSTAALGIEAQAEYAIGQYAVGARVGYDNAAGGGSGLIGNGDAIYTSGGVFVYPYAVANFDNGSFVRIGVAYSAGIDTAKSLFQIPLVYVWSF
jgi:hypothetical protein